MAVNNVGCMKSQAFTQKDTYSSKRSQTSWIFRTPRFFSRFHKSFWSDIVRVPGSSWGSCRGCTLANDAESSAQFHQSDPIPGLSPTHLPPKIGPLGKQDPGRGIRGFWGFKEPPADLFACQSNFKFGRSRYSALAAWDHFAWQSVSRLLKGFIGTTNKGEKALFWLVRKLMKYVSINSHCSSVGANPMKPYESCASIWRHSSCFNYAVHVNDEEHSCIFSNIF